MLVSTKGRYALRMMIFLAAQANEAPVSLKEVSEHEGISLKYLEQVARPLADAGLIRSARGKNGGYALSRPPEQINAGEVLRAAEGTTAPVSCLESGQGCPRADACTTIAFWRGLDQAIDDYVSGVALAELAG